MNRVQARFSRLKNRRDAMSAEKDGNGTWLKPRGGCPAYSTRVYRFYSLFAFSEARRKPSGNYPCVPAAEKAKRAWICRPHLFCLSFFCPSQKCEIALAIHAA